MAVIAFTAIYRQIVNQLHGSAVNFNKYLSFFFNGRLHSIYIQ